MRDETPQELQRRTNVQDSLRRHLLSHGYQTIDTPLLEPTELFLRKSGGELATRMYTFTDPGGNKVSLRPEFTASAIRYYLERDDTGPLPMRLQYCGPIFRHDEAQGYRQFHQTGAEVIGAPAPDSDGEVLALAWEGLSLMHAPSPTCVVGHVGVLHLMLEEIGLSHRAQAFLIASLTRLKQDPEEGRRVLEQANSLGLMKSAENVGGSRLLVDDMEEKEALDLLQDLFHDPLSGLLGSRSMDEILTRFIQKIRGGDNPQRVERGISLFSRLASMSGEEEQSLPQLRSLLQEYRISPAVLGPLEKVLASFHRRCPSASITVDIGLVRGIAYYTGMVFEILAPGPQGPLTLCGGGRYDGLVKALGGEKDVPTLGFAYTLETLLDLLPEKLEERHLTSSNPQRR
ncbi:MAG: histidine--tRNA ligase family protein [Chloroflexi bacterium]|nr:histidine--tRNA ligase family protein [Chloroflexota bacterium]